MSLWAADSTENTENARIKHSYFRMILCLDFVLSLPPSSADNWRILFLIIDLQYCVFVLPNIKCVLVCGTAYPLIIHVAWRRKSIWFNSESTQVRDNHRYSIISVPDKMFSTNPPIIWTWLAAVCHTAVCSFSMNKARQDISLYALYILQCLCVCRFEDDVMVTLYLIAIVSHCWSIEWVAIVSGKRITCYQKASGVELSQVMLWKNTVF